MSPQYADFRRGAYCDRSRYQGSVDVGSVVGRLGGHSGHVWRGGRRRMPLGDLDFQPRKLLTLMGCGLRAGGETCVDDKQVQRPSRERRTAATTLGIGSPVNVSPQPAGSGAITGSSTASGSMARSAIPACSSVQSGTRRSSFSLAVTRLILRRGARPITGVVGNKRATAPTEPQRSPTNSPRENRSRKSPNALKRPSGPNYGTEGQRFESSRARCGDSWARPELSRVR